MHVLYPGSGFFDFRFSIKRALAEDWGCYGEAICAPDSARPVLLRAVADDGQQTDVDIEMTVDTRYAQVAELSESAEIFQGVIEEDGGGKRVIVPPVRLMRSPREVQAALILDLGNTRSFALLADDLLGLADEHELTRPLVPISLRSYGGRLGEVETGVFDSIVSLENAARFGDDVLARLREVDMDGFGIRHAFVRVGKYAALLCRHTAGHGRRALSSPKRYFWQGDPELLGWLAHDASTRDPCSQPCSFLLEHLLGEGTGGAATLARKHVLSGMIVELLEQAERQLNNPEEVDPSHRVPGVRRIEHVYVTYPPAWADKERELYADVLQTGVATHARLRSLPVPKTHVECDEATAVLLFYVANEISKLGGDPFAWVRLVGREEMPDTYAVRIATCDIGGGTSDLVVARVRAMRDNLGQTLLTVSRCYQDGIPVAGDELLCQVTRCVVLPFIGNWLCDSDPVLRQQLIHDVLIDHNALDELGRLRAKWARFLWFPLALHFLRVLMGEERRVSIEVPSALLEYYYNFYDAIRRSADRLRAGQRLRSRTQPRIDLTEAQTARYRARCRAVAFACFTPIARRFGAAAEAFDCDMMLLAGKTSEISVVRDIFTNNVPLPPPCFMALQDYELSQDWARILRVGQRLDDAKKATVLGATINLLHQLKHPVFGANTAVQIEDVSVFKEQNQYWGVLRTAHNMWFTNETAIFNPTRGNRTCVIPMNDRSLLIARRRFGCEQLEAQVAYELRVKPGVLGGPRNARIRLAQEVSDAGGVSLTIEAIESGELAELGASTGVALTEEHIELRPRVLQSADFWLDSGVIPVPDWSVLEG